MAHLGERLRQQRLVKGVTIGHIAEQTNIGVRYLEALEAGDFKQLPGAIFARSFVRQYAEIVGTDASIMKSELQQIFPSEEIFPPTTPVQSGTLRAKLQNHTLLAANGPVWRQLPLTAISLATALVVSSGLYVGWQQVVLHNETSEQAAPAQTPAAKAPVSKSNPGVNPDPPPASPTVVPAAVTQPEVPAVDSIAKPSTEFQAGQSTGAAAMALKVVASAETWVSIAVNGKPVYRGLLRPYEERTVTGVEYARMVIGNSTGVDVLADGRSIGPIGPQGSVRVVVLTPGSPPQISERADFPANQQQQPDPSRETGSDTATTGTKLD